MKSLFELYKPRAKKEKEWWDANKVEKKPLVPGEKTDFTGDSVKTYDREKMGAKAGKDTAGEVCENIDEAKKQRRKWPKINSGNEGSDDIDEPSDVRS